MQKKQECFPPQWDIAHLRTHLQEAVKLEFWTIAYYMSAMYSLKDRASAAYRLVQSVVYQEMLHVELAGNLTNAFGGRVRFDTDTPEWGYHGKHIPVLRFNIDTPDPREIYHPYSAEIGPLDEERLNAMCLIEYPEWLTESTPNLQEDIYAYGSIGEFYQAVAFGAGELADHIVGDRKQVDQFQNFYNHFKQPTITDDGPKGLPQALNLIWAITDQGEGQVQGDKAIPLKYQNTADGFQPSWSHFRKFNAIRDLPTPPRTYTGDMNPKKGSPGYEAQQTLIRNFTVFRGMLDQLFSGPEPPNFGSLMPTLGGNILTCWQRGAIPKFYPDQT